MEIWAFFGLIGHYRQFIKGFAWIAQPLNEHLAGEGARRKSEWVSLSENVLEAFQVLKQACMSSPVLAFADYMKDFLLKTDASKERLGAVLSQKQADGCYHPVAYGSWALTAYGKSYHSTAGQVLVEMHVTNWVAAQKEDPELDAVLQWIEAKKKTDLRTLGKHTFSQEGWIIWRNCQNFTVLQNAFYLCSTPKGENEDLLLFIVPKAHLTAALNGCHQDAGHQGCDLKLLLLQEHLWWPRMAKQMRQTIRAWTRCLQFEGGLSKAPLCPIVATTPLDLLRVDFTSIETTLELNQSPTVANVLVFQDHFTKHVLAYVTPDQTAKTVAKFLYGGYISILGAPARLLSDRGASFTSNVIEELCKILGIKWLWTMPYIPQTNGLVERSHQTIMSMIRKLGEDKKADWPSHLAEIVHTYNATQSAVTRYSPHYLMFGCRPRLPVDFVFPTIGSNKALWREASAKHVDVYVALVWDRLRTALWEVQAQSSAEAHRQKWYYDRKIGAVNLKPGDLVLVKADAWKGKRKIEDRWEEETLGGGASNGDRWSPLTKWQTNTESHKSSTKTDFFLSCQRLAFPCVWPAIIHGTGVPAPPHTRLTL